MVTWLPAAIGAAGAIGSALISADSNRSASNRNADLQREFAQHGISWKVADAKRAGVHPLAALGAQTQSASPVYVGGNDSGMREASQHIANSFINAKQSELLDAQIRKINMEAKAIEASIPGQGSVAAYDPMTGNVVGSTPGINNQGFLPQGRPGVSQKVIPQEAYMSTIDGGYKLSLSEEAAELVESSWPDLWDYIWTRVKRTGHTAAAAAGFEGSFKEIQWTKPTEKMFRLPKGYKWAMVPSLSGPTWYPVPDDGTGRWWYWTRP